MKSRIPDAHSWSPISHPHSEGSDAALCISDVSCRGSGEQFLELQQYTRVMHVPAQQPEALQTWKPSESLWNKFELRWLSCHIEQWHKILSKYYKVY